METRAFRACGRAAVTQVQRRGLIVLTGSSQSSYRFAKERFVIHQMD